MAKFTSGFGVLLTVVGIMGYVFTRNLLTLEFGILLLISGVLADSTDRRRRMIAMHSAAVIGLLGFLMMGYPAIRAYLDVHRHGAKIDWMQMHNLQEVTASLCLMFVVVCVGSFILARRTPAAVIPAEA